MADGTTAPEYRIGAIPVWVKPALITVALGIVAAMVKSTFDESFANGTITVKEIDDSPDEGAEPGAYDRRCPSPLSSTGFHEYNLEAGKNGLLTGACKWCGAPY